jgi:hypothetical protein
MEYEQTSSDWTLLKKDFISADKECSPTTPETALIRPARLRIVARCLDEILAQDAYAAVIEVQLLTGNREPVVLSGDPVPLSIQPSPSWNLQWERGLAQIVEKGDKLEMLCIVLLQKTLTPASVVRSGAILGYALLPAAQLRHCYTSNDPIQIRLKDRFHGDCDVSVEFSIPDLEPDSKLFHRALHTDQVLEKQCAARLTCSSYQSTEQNSASATPSPEVHNFSEQDDTVGVHIIQTRGFPYHHLLKGKALRRKFLRLAVHARIKYGRAKAETSRFGINQYFWDQGVQFPLNQSCDQIKIKVLVSNIRQPLVGEAQINIQDALREGKRWYRLSNMGPDTSDSLELLVKIYRFNAQEQSLLTLAPETPACETSFASREICIQQALHRLHSSIVDVAARAEQPHTAVYVPWHLPCDYMGFHPCTTETYDLRDQRTISGEVSVKLLPSALRASALGGSGTPQVDIASRAGVHNRVNSVDQFSCRSTHKECNSSQQHGSILDKALAILEAAAVTNKSKFSDSSSDAKPPGSEHDSARVI